METSCGWFLSALGDIKIAEVNVKGLFVRLINSSLDKELEIGGHILQQNVNGQTVSLYCFLPNIIMQANCTVTVSKRCGQLPLKQSIRHHQIFFGENKASLEQAQTAQRFCANRMVKEKENPPNPFPNSSPWCYSPSVPAHPYSPLIETCATCMARSSLNRQPRPHSSRPDPAQDNNIQI
ncbi:lamin tail domain-containing protein 1 [Ursus arctos]|uniref:lamin tail domain-containing protein 1 n=1 Tax=Ursus arctos TaxID=9644 RepID=UPI001CF8F6A4|nr:lamin tail domain-containing protein 1 [Ursus arctos]